jgi:anti-anti-sigma factor
VRRGIVAAVAAVGVGNLATDSVSRFFSPGRSHVNLQIESFGEVRVVRVKEDRLIFPLLSTFSSRISELIEDGARKLVINLANVSYLDSASYGCLLDIYRMMSERGGTMKLVGLQERVGAMAMGSLVGLTRLIETFREEEKALKSF